MTLTSIRFSLLTSVIFALLLLTAAACSDDKNDNKTPTIGVGGSAATGGAAADTGGAAADTGGTGNDATGGAESTTGGSSSGVGGGSTGGASTSGTCTHDVNKTDCYECPPTTNDQILTACTGAMCRPFDNTARGVPASLPPIP